MIDKLVAAPTIEPITLAEAKEHLQYTAADQDNYITGLITFAREAAEGLTKRCMISQTREATRDYFPDTIILRPNVTSIISVTYYDTAGVQKTLDPQDYMLDNAAGTSAHWCLPMPGKSFPSTQDGRANSVVVRYQSGYINAANVPRVVKQWMMLQIGNMFANRESLVIGTIVGEFAANGLLDHFKVYEI